MKKTSYPKNKIKVLLLENISPLAAAKFVKETYQVKSLKGALSEKELEKELGLGINILGIRSKTEVSASVIKKANSLLSIGAFCIGTNQIDLKTCDLSGVAVFNAPFSNTRSVVELALSNIIALLRRSFEKSQMLKQGIWDKSAMGCFEARGKVLGILGYGKIGSQLSVLAESLGMKVCFFDTDDRLALGNAKKCKNLSELLKISDVLSVHIDGRAENKNFLSHKELALMKKGAYLINSSRGFVVDVSALEKMLKSGHLAGAALDVFPAEPKEKGAHFSSPLQDLPNVILTPHIAGSTEEAQADIADYVPGRIVDFINTGNTSMSVNFPNVLLPKLIKAHRIIHIHENVPGILAHINKVFAENKINILGQYLKTNERIGYTITDIETKHSNTLLSQLKSIPHTIKARILY